MNSDSKAPACFSLTSAQILMGATRHSTPGDAPEYVTGFTPWEKTRVSRCVIPDHEWDGDTGIPRLLEEYRK